jgi:hypothetical protein
VSTIVTAAGLACIAMLSPTWSGFRGRSPGHEAHGCLVTSPTARGAARTTKPGRNWITYPSLRKRRGKARSELDCPLGVVGQDAVTLELGQLSAYAGYEPVYVGYWTPVRSKRAMSRVGEEIEDVLLLSLTGSSPNDSEEGLTPNGGHLTGGTAGPAGRMSVCRASVASTPRSFGSRLPAW